MNKIKVAILCGGRSSEHEISCISAGGILKALDRQRYEPILIGITRLAGRWVLMAEDSTLEIVDGILPTVPEDAPEVNTDIHGFSVDGKTLHIDLIFPMLHGSFGEDGSIQGFCEIANLAYVGSGVLASAVAMDKSFAKSIFSSSGLNLAEGIVFTQDQWSRNRASCELLASVLKYPLFVKPARGGSSRGTSKVHTADVLQAAIEEAFRFDSKVMIEEAVSGREIECAVLEVEGNIIASLPGEIVIDSKHEFYDFEAKYLDGATTALIPANIPAEARAEIQKQASLAFRSLGCSGLARVDFFYGEDGQITINELNTMPGFTPTSMFPKLMESVGISYSQIIDELMKGALSRRN
ncbi:MAG: D-alanine--D-alanine ligase [Actinobacteria bacterium]|uniref:Unannotated protein n=1 Tax=freshwater metagenome TaxID=449393 RepID=A0A6J7TCU7_9ZZZZ|nr:D-alanine--D-alanine ligase [Actinomycetota bacterium]MSX25290.1 D-alanine--D-alanine ligase [Actinomycetota bacterium]MSY46298.1 D-alanine--D-alanine ligase [Actinomycetota bacterium]MSY57740.1 D-alanine--D-alanine ligase [Actinomycetota bacterium]MTA99829.1 D-alanine--D-alanine ligase [Actinomycetota bacterium]